MLLWIRALRKTSILKAHPSRPLETNEGQKDLTFSALTHDLQLHDVLHGRPRDDGVLGAADDALAVVVLAGLVRDHARGRVVLDVGLKKKGISVDEI